MHQNYYYHLVVKYRVPAACNVPSRSSFHTVTLSLSASYFLHTLFSTRRTNSEEGTDQVLTKQGYTVYENLAETGGIREL
jgi:hypothetical protein